MGEKGSADLLQKLQRENTDVSSQNVSAYCIINFDLCESSLKKKVFLPLCHTRCVFWNGVKHNACLIMGVVGFIPRVFSRIHSRSIRLVGNGIWKLPGMVTIVSLEFEEFGLVVNSLLSCMVILIY